MNELVNVEILFNSDLLIEIGKAMETMQRKYGEGFEKSMITLRDMIRERTPYATGNLYWSINYEIIETTEKGPYGFARGMIGFEGRVFAGKIQKIISPPRTYREIRATLPEYAAPVEHGTIPHWPPWDPLLRWVRLILRPETMLDELWTVFKIGRHISIYGTPGSHMFKLGGELFESQGILEANMKQAGEEGMAIITAEKQWWAF